MLQCISNTKVVWLGGKFLLQELFGYIIAYNRYLVSTPSTMTDQERDEIDSAAQDFIRSCSDKIENLHQKGTCTCSSVHVRNYTYISHNINYCTACYIFTLYLLLCIVSGGHPGGTSGADPSTGCV